MRDFQAIYGDFAVHEPTVFFATFLFAHELDESLGCILGGQ
jgi:hypothetical protein